MKIVLVHRPELMVSDEPDPFEGIEILGVANSDNEAQELIDRIKDENSQNYEGTLEPPANSWFFQIDTV